MFAALNLWGYTFVEVAIAIVVIAAICALVWVALRQFQVTIPPWVIQVFWILVVAFVVVVAIKLVSSL